MKKYIIGGVVAVVFGAVAVYALLPSMTPYVSFAEARNRSGQTVQVMGRPDIETVAADSKSSTYTFAVTDDDGTRMTTRAPGAPPARLKEATHVVLVGRFSEGVFQADEVLLKCPSKYEKEDLSKKKQKASN